MFQRITYASGVALAGPVVGEGDTGLDATGEGVTGLGPVGVGGGGEDAAVGVGAGDSPLLLLLETELMVGALEDLVEDIVGALEDLEDGPLLLVAAAGPNVPEPADEVDLLLLILRSAGRSSIEVGYQGP